MSLECYSREQLIDMGMQVGQYVYINKTVIFVNPDKIKIGNNVRIDCFCLLSAGDKGIYIGNNVHIAASTLFFGGGGKIVMEDFSCVSSRCALYTASDDYIEGNMTNPTIPMHYRKISCGDIILQKHVVVGTGCTILHNVNLGYGCSIGAMSLVKDSMIDGAVAVGIPAKRYRYRDLVKLKNIEKEYDRDTKK